MICARLASRRDSGHAGNVPAVLRRMQTTRGETRCAIQRDPLSRGGRIRRGNVLALAALAAAIVITGGVWPRAEATPTEVDRLVAILESPIPERRKLVVVEELRQLDTSAARDALGALAENTDDRVAMVAIRALGRSEWNAAGGAIEDVYEDTGRSDLVRGAALGAFLVRESASGETWASCKGWVKQHAGGNAALNAQYAAVKTELWPIEQEVDDE